MAMVSIIPLTGCGSDPKAQDSFPAEIGQADAYVTKKRGLKNQQKCKEGSHLNYDNFGEAFSLTTVHLVILVN